MPLIVKAAGVFSKNPTTEQAWTAVNLFMEQNWSTAFSFTNSLFGNNYIAYADRIVLFNNSIMSMLYLLMSVDLKNIVNSSNSELPNEITLKFIEIENGTAMATKKTITKFEFALLCALLYLNPETSGITEPERVALVSSEYEAALGANFANGSLSREQFVCLEIRFKGLLKHFRSCSNSYYWLMRCSGTVSKPINTVATPVGSNTSIPSQKAHASKPNETPSKGFELASAAAAFLSGNANFEKGGSTKSNSAHRMIADETLTASVVADLWQCFQNEVGKAKSVGGSSQQTSEKTRLLAASPTISVVSSSSGSGTGVE